MRIYTEISVTDIYNRGCRHPDLEEINYIASTEEVLKNLTNVKVKDFEFGSDFGGRRKFKDLRIWLIREEQIKFLENLKSISKFKKNKK